MFLNINYKINPEEANLLASLFFVYYNGFEVMSMDYQDYLSNITNAQHRNKLSNIIQWAINEFPDLYLEMKWNQPMLLAHKTFIIGFSVTKNHLSIAPEKMILDKHIDDIKKHYNTSKMLFKIKWNETIDYDLFKLIIHDTLNEKQGMDKFWM